MKAMIDNGLEQESDAAIRNRMQVILDKVAGVVREYGHGGSFERPDDPEELTDDDIANMTGHYEAVKSDCECALDYLESHFTEYRAYQEILRNRRQSKG